MILAVYFDRQQPTRVHETYTFKFSYPTEIASNFAVRVSKRNKNILDRSQYRCYNQIIEQTIIATRNLAPLPEKFFLTLKLLFNETCTPSKYSIKQFRATTGNDRPWDHSTSENEYVKNASLPANSSSCPNLKRAS